MSRFCIIRNMQNLSTSRGSEQQRYNLGGLRFGSFLKLWYWDRNMQYINVFHLPPLRSKNILRVLGISAIVFKTKIAGSPFRSWNDCCTTLILALFQYQSVILDLCMNSSVSESLLLPPCGAVLPGPVWPMSGSLRAFQQAFCSAVMLPNLSKPCWCNRLWLEQRNHALTSQCLRWTGLSGRNWSTTPAIPARFNGPFTSRVSNRRYEIPQLKGCSRQFPNEKYLICGFANRPWSILTQHNLWLLTWILSVHKN